MNTNQSATDNAQVGKESYIVQQGDCIASIAEKYGLLWETIWNHSDNSELQRVRKDPNLLLPGDKVSIPQIRDKSEHGSTQQSHRFRRKGSQTVLRLRILDNGESLINEIRYILNIDSTLSSGATDNNGQIELMISPDAREGTLTLIEDDEMTEYHLAFGHMDPYDEISGIQGRLNNLGYNPGPIDGVMGPKTQMALRTFQKDYNLEVNGQMNENTLSKLKEVYGS